MRTTLALLAAGTFVVPIRANVISSLYGSGVNNSHVPLSDGAVDPHYTLTASPDSSFPPGSLFAVNSNAIGFVSGPWAGNGPNSRWIAPSAAAQNFAAGLYTYHTEFSLSGFNPSTASISGQWAMDDAATDLRLNGFSTGIVRSGSFNFFNLTSFTISSGFLPGLNTLDFVIQNAPPNGSDPNPSGLQVALNGTATPVPEPGACMLAALGFTICAARRFWRCH
jgi:hypothetical protein